jgi:hypothetical protein
VCGFMCIIRWLNKKKNKNPFWCSTNILTSTLVLKNSQRHWLALSQQQRNIFNHIGQRRKNSTDLRQLILPSKFYQSSSMFFHHNNNCFNKNTEMISSEGILSAERIYICLFSIYPTYVYFDCCCRFKVRSWDCV